MRLLRVRYLAAGLATMVGTAMAQEAPRLFGPAPHSLPAPLLAALKGFAQNPATPDAASKQWLLYVDGGDYTKGWDRAGSPFKNQMPASVLQSKIAPVREPLGAVMERKLFHVTYSNTAPGLPDGKYAEVKFRSRFANKVAVGETVWLDMENDHWLVIGYLIGSAFQTPLERQ
jgi:hypothetical protein